MNSHEHQYFNGASLIRVWLFSNKLQKETKHRYRPQNDVEVYTDALVLADIFTNILHYGSLTLRKSQICRRFELVIRTLWRVETLQASFILCQRPSESLDRNSFLGAWEKSEEWLDNASELLTAPLVTQSHERWQSHADEEQGKTVYMSYHDQTCL